MGSSRGPWEGSHYEALAKKREEKSFWRPLIYRDPEYRENEVALFFLIPNAKRNVASYSLHCFCAGSPTPGLCFALRSTPHSVPWALPLTCRTLRFIMSLTPPRHFNERLLVSPPSAACTLLEHTFPNCLFTKKKREQQQQKRLGEVYREVILP